MKKVRCPICGRTIAFDETQYPKERTLIFECPDCLKTFRIRLLNKREETSPQLATLTVVENAFQEKQTIAIRQGDNVIGRHVKGTKANAAFRTVDPSIDTTHCIIKAEVDPQNGLSFVTPRVVLVRFTKAKSLKTQTVFNCPMMPLSILGQRR